MSTKYPEIWNALAAEFPAHLVRERPAGGNRKVRYITARTAANRLDDVLGFENWEDEYEHDPGGGDNITCKLTVTLPDGRKVRKSDNGSPGSTGDDGEDEKGAFSDAFKRAAAKFGVGRYLYGEGVYTAPVAGQTDALARPAARPAPVSTPESEPMRSRAPRSNGMPSGAPRSGGALYGWLKDQEKAHGVGLLKYVDGWAKIQEFPRMMKDWDEAQVELARAEALRKLQTIAAPRGEAYEEALVN